MMVTRLAYKTSSKVSLLTVRRMPNLGQCIIQTVPFQSTFCCQQNTKSIASEFQVNVFCTQVRPPFSLLSVLVVVNINILPFYLVNISRVWEFFFTVFPSFILCPLSTVANASAKEPVTDYHQKVSRNATLWCVCVCACVYVCACLSTDLLVFLEVGNHDDSWRVQLPHHAPKIIEGSGNGSLGGNVPIGMVETLQHGRLAKKN